MTMDPSFPGGDEPPAPESYPTFWDAIPVDAPDAAAPLTDAPGDAYTAFLDLSEDGPTATLSVEESDVGLN